MHQLQAMGLRLRSKQWEVFSRAVGTRGLPGPHRLWGVTGHIALWWHDIRWSKWMAVNSNRLDPLCAQVCRDWLPHCSSARQGNGIFPSVEGKLVQVKWGVTFLHLGWCYSKARLQNLLLYNKDTSWIQIYNQVHNVTELDRGSEIESDTISKMLYRLVGML